jgi:hypothetical protein
MLAQHVSGPNAELGAAQEVHPVSDRIVIAPHSNRRYIATAQVRPQARRGSGDSLPHSQRRPRSQGLSAAYHADCDAFDHQLLALEVDDDGLEIGVFRQDLRDLAIIFCAPQSDATANPQRLVYD